MKIKSSGFSNITTIILSLMALIVLGIVLFISRSNNDVSVNEPIVPVVQPTIKIDSPVSGQEVNSPLAISGQARGSWFFEAVFPVKIEDSEGNTIAEGRAQAVGDWMTSDFVTFDASIDFKVTEKKKAEIVFRKDNPSGLPENDGEFRMPVVLLPTASDDFIKTGNLIQHNLGEGTWYLSYEEPGKPGLEAALVFSDESRCKSGADTVVCDIGKFQAGQRVEISGRRTGDMVLVSILTLPEQEPSQKKEINLYYYNPSLDKDASGNILCSRKGLVPVKRQLPASITPIQDAIKLLIQGGLTAEEKQQGITTEYPLLGFVLKGASQKNDVLTLDFADPNNKTGGGACRVGILWFQIEATAKQFPGVNSVKPLNETLFQP